MSNKYQIEDPNNVGEIIVSWIITHTCQERCGYCISPLGSHEITDEREHFEIQNKMLKGGLTKNRYIGGEPLMVPHLPKLVEDAYKRGVNTRLSTNGILLTPEKFKELKYCLNSIAFPFESMDNVLNEQIRGITGRTHSEIVSNRISMVKDAGTIGVLVNTCVHKENISYLLELGYHLSNLGVDHWKLRRFNSASGRGAVPNKERFEITDEEFYAVVAKLQATYQSLRIDGRMPSKLASRLMISPQGDLYRMIGAEEDNIYYGNMLTNDLNIGEISRKDHCD